MSEEDNGSPQETLEGLTIKNFTITDEFISVMRDLPCRDLAKKLMEVPKGVIFALEDETPVGAITAREFLIATMNGDNLQEMVTEDIMNTNIMEIGMDDNISEVIQKISKFAPYAIVVKDSEGAFRGYFSPNDYREALKRLGL
ncbi:MAG: CBS domain-containing protein [Candidatus Thermoplasmatota archaeon]|nr:CBS domain-containing protein [Candidatus Thermoplasmatota archaeon]